jgi:hypothetical protein
MACVYYIYDNKGKRCNNYWKGFIILNFSKIISVRQKICSFNALENNLLECGFTL